MTTPFYRKVGGLHIFALGSYRFQFCKVKARQVRLPKAMPLGEMLAGLETRSSFGLEAEIRAEVREIQRLRTWTDQERNHFVI